jgi:hypothetical protein
MQIPFANDSLDDSLDRALAAGFMGMDKATNPTLLEPGIVQDGLNVYFKGEGIARTRPAFVATTNVFTAAPVTTSDIRGMTYYDLPDYEGTLIFADDRVYSITGTSVGLTATQRILHALSTTNNDVYFAQLVDRIYYIRNGTLYWVMNTAGVWTAGSVTTFSDGSAMPTWTRIATQGFRLFLMEAEGYKLYASQIGAASLAANWVNTDNIRVGSGEGDPARALIPSQGRYLTMITARAAWQIDTSDASVANWPSLRITSLAGCVEGKTAVAIGQDVYYLSRIGVVNLQALVETISIASQATLSWPIQPYIDRINWSAINRAFSTTWQDLFIIALPLDSDTQPKHFFAFNIRTRAWSTPWQSTAPTNPVTSVAFGGYTFATTTNFGDKAETIISDNTGRVYYLDNTGQYVTDTAGSGSSDVYINTWLATRSFTHDAPEAQKQAAIAEMEFIISQGSQVIDMTLQLTKESSSTVTIYTGTPSVITNPAQSVWRSRYNARSAAASMGHYRDAYLKLTLARGQMKLRSLALHGYVDGTDLST